MELDRKEFIKGAAASSAGLLLSVWLSKFEPINLENVVGQTQDNSSGLSARRYVMVIDLDKCNGCCKCTEACQAEMDVPPAWGEPEYEGRQPWIQVFDLGNGTSIPVPCQNCQNAPCAKVCPVGATYYSEDHVVLIAQDRCIGCRICLAACPYERRFFNWFDPPLTTEEQSMPYSPDYNMPHRRGVTEKCIWCRHRAVEGRVPACVEGCSRSGMSAMWFGDVAQDVATNGTETVSLSSLLANRGAYRLKEELGTQPSVIYLPPRGATTS